MVQPVIDTVTPNPAEPRQQVLAIGTGFGFVSEAFFENNTTHELFRAAYEQVFDGEHILITTPADIATNVDYVVVLVTLEDEVSINNAGLLHIQPISGTVPQPTPLPTPSPYPLPASGTSVGLDRLRDTVRLELSDPATTFQTRLVGDGEMSWFDLPVRHVEATTLIVKRIPAGGDSDDAVDMVADTDYTLDSFQGVLTTPVPVADGDTLYVTGTRYRFFDNTRLDMFIQEAFVQIARGRTQVTATINAQGYRQYEEFAITFDTLPEVEILPTAIQAKIQALWVLATDAMYDIDISEDGANIPRSERYRQILGQIQAETQRFNDMAEALNIGLHRIEITTLRRVSRMTGRLVPVYLEKEYDDHRLPTRELPGVDHGVGEGQEFVDPYYQAGADYGGGFGP